MYQSLKSSDNKPNHVVCIAISGNCKSGQFFPTERQSIIMALALIMIMFWPCVQAAPLITQRVSVNSKGIQGNDASNYVTSVSATGRWVAFMSIASNLVAHDTNDVADIFVRDRYTKKTKRVSVNSKGVQADNANYYASISANGRWVAFMSSAVNLVTDDNNDAEDIFVRDCKTGKTERISVDSKGLEANNGSDTLSISADGRWVTFSSMASNLVADDANGTWDIFVHDRKTGKTERVSVNSAGAEANGGSHNPSISSDGRWVAFVSEASNLIADDTNNVNDVFVYDRETGKTKRLSIDSQEQEANNNSDYTSISADGRWVAFDSRASNLVADDTNGSLDTFVHDLKTGKTERVSVDSAGLEGNSSSGYPSISASGRWVAFGSNANLVSNDINGTSDIFIHDREKGTTRRVSVNSAGHEANGQSLAPAMSANGRWVAFESDASNLVKKDSNGSTDIFVKQLW